MPLFPWSKEHAQRKYIDLIKEASSKWANWDPTKPIQAGDFGTVNKKTGELMIEGNIYKHNDIATIANQHPLYEAPEVDQYQIHSYEVRGLDARADLSANIAGFQGVAFRSQWKFNKKRGAILWLHKPRLICVPDTFFPNSLQIPLLKGKSVVYQIFICPGFYMYLSNKSSEQVTVSLRANIPPAIPGVSINPALSLGWSAEGCSGVRQHAYRSDPVYTPLFCLKSIQRPLLRRDESGTGRDSVRYLRWEETDVPWDDLDEDG
ncbi:hypothetical protein B0F90DRAFT_1625955 [Multifurca ochricompacta]|uniref:Uncharacterized protein n=1 Tax=Multifurca ochricompacta TaxID=376703 RepID=A0AAD4QQ72_9AGAM|nr:hypothetical protein B0F90DRAFT_1625955 [Multifurca ochricompacta]